MSLLPTIDELDQSAQKMGFDTLDSRVKAVLLAQLWCCKSQSRLLRQVNDLLSKEMAEVAERLIAAQVEFDEEPVPEAN